MDLSCSKNLPSREKLRFFFLFSDDMPKMAPISHIPSLAHLGLMFASHNVGEYGRAHGLDWVSPNQFAIMNNFPNYLNSKQ